MKFAGTAHFTTKPLFCLILLISFCTNSALAWDGQRKGFILGVGVGPGFTSYTTIVESGYGDEVVETHNVGRYSGFGLHTDLKIGYAPSEQIQIYWMSENSWSKDDYNNGIALHGVAGLGLSFYLKPVSPSWYFSAGVGYATWDPPLYPPPCSWIEFLIEEYYYFGFGLSSGIGYEFAQHWSAEFNVTWGNPSDERPGAADEHSYEFIRNTRNAFSTGLTINVLGY